MFCSNCGKNLMDGTKFCQYCGTPVRSAGGRSEQATVARPQGVESALNQPSGQAGMTGQRTTPVQSGPAHIRPAARTGLADAAPEKKKKKPFGAIIVAAIAVVAVIFGVSYFKGIKEPPMPGDIIIPGDPEDDIIYGNENSDRKTITVDASKQGEALVPSMDSYGDTSDAIEDFGKRLAQSGAADAARDVYSMVPKAELAQAARDQSEKLESSSNGPVQVYNMYKDVKQMFTSIYGEEGE